MIKTQVKPLFDFKTTMAFDEKASQNQRSGTPTNQQIIDAAKSAYVENQQVVDGLTQAVVGFVNVAANAEAVANVQSYDWTSFVPDASVVNPIIDDQSMKKAISRAAADGQFRTFSLGATQSRIGKTQSGAYQMGSGISSPNQVDFIVKYLVSNVVFPPNVTSSMNLDTGIWVADAKTGENMDAFALSVGTTVAGTSVMLTILVDSKLKLFGFDIATGVEMQGSATVHSITYSTISNSNSHGESAGLANFYIKKHKTIMSGAIYGEALEGIHVSELDRKPAASARALTSGPSNQQILDAAKIYYAQHQPAVDACTESSNTFASVPNGRTTISNIHGQVNNFHNKTLNSTMTTNTQGAFDTNSNPQCGGIFGGALCKTKADMLFSTIGLGMSANAEFIVGGAGGVGCAWDIAKREGPKGYGYLLGEIGLAVDLAINIECVIFNQLPSALDFTMLGLAVEAGFGLGARLSIMADTSLKNLYGFTIGIGVQVGGGAVVFGGHIWNFG